MPSNNKMANQSPVCRKLKTILPILVIIILIGFTVFVVSRTFHKIGYKYPKFSGVGRLTQKQLFAKKWNVTDFTNQYHVITMLSLYCGQIWPGYESFTREQLDARDLEYLDVLESNINHPLVAEVHLFYTNEDALKVLKQQKWVNMRKITPVKTERRIHMMDFFYYAQKYLLNKPVIALNGDIVIGEGFDLIDTVRMRDEKTLYSLTRHGYKSDVCTTDNYCLDKKYQGSHDTHIFRLNEQLDETLLLRLDYPINLWQAENGMIGAFKFHFNYFVHNPCRIVKTYHHHCSPVHKQGGMSSIIHPPYQWAYDQLGKAAPEDTILYGPGT